MTCMHDYDEQCFCECAGCPRCENRKDENYESEED